MFMVFILFGGMGLKPKNIPGKHAVGMKDTQANTDGPQVIRMTLRT